MAYQVSRWNIATKDKLQLYSLESHATWMSKRTQITESTVDDDKWKTAVYNDIAEMSLSNVNVTPA